jgi:hypothetical protein
VRVSIDRAYRESVLRWIWLAMLFGGCMARDVVSLVGPNPRVIAEREATMRAHTQALVRAARDAAKRGDCNKVRSLERQLLRLASTEAAHDDLLLEPAVRLCLVGDACRSLRTWLAENPDMVDEPAVRSRAAQCKGVALPDAPRQTPRERCLEERGAAMIIAQAIAEPHERGRALGKIMRCP